MKIKYVASVLIPPVLCVGGAILASPEVMSWPLVIGLAVILGVFSALALRLFD